MSYIDNPTSTGGVAPASATYVVVSLDPTLTAERQLAATDGLSLVDAGPNSTLTVRSSLARTFTLMGS